MKNTKRLILSLSFMVLAGVIMLAVFLFRPFEEQNKNRHELYKENTALYPSYWMDYQRAWPHDYIKPESYIEAMQQASQLKNNNRGLLLDWEFEGPTNIGGRITDLAVHPSDLSTIYVGAASGGVLKTTNGGITWTNTFADAAVVSIGAVAVDPNNPDVLYAGTGEANASSYSFMGDGIYKTTDAGQTWFNTGLPYSAYIGRIVVDYDDSDRVFVAACGNLFSTGGERGIYRSTNGGASWENVLFVNDSTAGVDLVQHPQNPDILYAAMWERHRGLNFRNSFGDGSGIWKTTDGGDTWTEMTNGVPTGSNVGRIGLAIAKSNPDVLYAVYDMPNYVVGVYRSADGGVTWTSTNDGVLDGMNSSFGWYFGQIRVDPTDENRVYVFGVNMYRSTNGGNSWNSIGNSMHVDHHAMYIDENTGLIIEGNDGGLYKSTNQGSNWQKINNLGITQFYDISIDYQLPYRIYGGTQDNNTIRTLSGGADFWQAILGGDGFYSLVDYTNSDIIFAESQWGGLAKSINGGYDFYYIADPMSGDRVNWSAPLIMHPTDPETLYFGTYRVWKSTNGGWDWSPVSGDLTLGQPGSFHTVTTLAISQLNPVIVVCGSADGRVHVSENNGQFWTDISEGLPQRWITRVETDPFDENTIYATVSGFRWDEAEPHVFKSTNLGDDWVSISGNLPDLPVNDIKADPMNAGYLFVGTDAGVFYTDNGGESWENIMSNLPNVPVTAIKIHNPTRKLVIGTYGISAYSLNIDHLVGVDENPKPERAEAKCYPNPVNFQRDKLTIGIEQMFDEYSSIEITDISGKKISVVRPVAGRKTASWNGLGNGGALVPPGIYIVRVTSGSAVYSAKIQVVK